MDLPHRSLEHRGREINDVTCFEQICEWACITLAFQSNLNLISRPLHKDFLSSSKCGQIEKTFLCFPRCYLFNCPVDDWWQDQIARNDSNTSGFQMIWFHLDERRASLLRINPIVSMRTPLATPKSFEQKMTYWLSPCDQR